MISECYYFLYKLYETITGSLLTVFGLSTPVTAPIVGGALIVGGVFIIVDSFLDSREDAKEINRRSSMYAKRAVTNLVLRIAESRFPEKYSN